MKKYLRKASLVQLHQRFSLTVIFTEKYLVPNLATTALADRGFWSGRPSTVLTQGGAWAQNLLKIDFSLKIAWKRHDFEKLLGAWGPCRGWTGWPWPFIWSCIEFGWVNAPVFAPSETSLFRSGVADLLPLFFVQDLKTSLDNVVDFTPVPWGFFAPPHTGREHAWWVSQPGGGEDEHVPHHPIYEAFMKKESGCYVWGRCKVSENAICSCPLQFPILPSRNAATETTSIRFDRPQPHPPAPFHKNPKERKMSCIAE